MGTGTSVSALLLKLLEGLNASIVAYVVDHWNIIVELVITFDKYFYPNFRIYSSRCYRCVPIAGYG